MSDRVSANIPPATLAAGDQADPAWWLACAVWHEACADDLAPTPANARFVAYHSAAALACRTFAAMMERAGDDVDWSIYLLRDGGQAFWSLSWGGTPRSLPAAAVAALTEDANG